MKLKSVWLLLALFALTGCDDTTGSLGLGVLPGTDAKEIKSTTYYVQTNSMPAGAVYAKTSTGYLGRYTDPDFGELDASFLTEFFCQTNSMFPELYDENKLYVNKYPMAGDTLNAAYLILNYSKYFGDPAVASHLNVYELKNRLAKHPYTDINPDDYYDPNDIIGERAYSAEDPLGNEYEAGYGHDLRIPLKGEFAQRILDHYRSHPEDFADPDLFIKNVFKGIYVKRDYGDGSILYIDDMMMSFSYNVHYTDSVGKIYKKQDGTDSIASTFAIIASTKEVVQANQIIQSQEEIAEKVAETQWTYLKTPAGIFTEVTLPLKEIEQNHLNDTISGVKLEFAHYYEKSNNKYGMTPPDTLLLVRKHNDEYIKFFEENRLYDGRTTYATLRDTINNKYVFSNIATLVNTCLAEKQNEKEKAQQEAGSSWNETTWEANWENNNQDWNKLVLIPIKQAYSGSGSSAQVVAIYHDLKPSYVRLKGGDPKATGEKGQLIELSIDYIDFSTKKK